MKIVRDPIAIYSVGEYIKEQNELLQNKQKEIAMHVNDILVNYQGRDAEMIVSSFLKEIKKLDKVIANLEYFSEYMKSLSTYDTDNLNNTKKKLKIQKDPIAPLMNDTYLNLDNINIINNVGGENNG